MQCIFRCQVKTASWELGLTVQMCVLVSDRCHQGCSGLSCVIWSPAKARGPRLLFLSLLIKPGIQERERERKKREASKDAQRIIRTIHMHRSLRMTSRGLASVGTRFFLVCYQIIQQKNHWWKWTRSLPAKAELVEISKNGDEVDRSLVFLGEPQKSITDRGTGLGAHTRR